MPTSRARILCLHGGGTSAAIFFAQTRRIRSALQSHFTFLFVDGPIEAGPGPGVLPYFEDSGPFYYWFSGAVVASDAARNAEVDAASRSIEVALAARGEATRDIVGVMGFSQGTITASLLLQRAQSGDASWAGLRFGILLCGGGQEELLGVNGELEVPSVHLHGLNDPWLANSRSLAKCYHPDAAVVMEFDGGHHIPTEAREIEQLAALVIEVSQDRSRRRQGETL